MLDLDIVCSGKFSDSHPKCEMTIIGQICKSSAKLFIVTHEKGTFLYHFCLCFHLARQITKPVLV
jgi:hypothetical protein